VINFGASLGKAKQSLPTPDEITRTETEKAEGDGPKLRIAKVKAGGVIVLNFVL